MSLRSGYFCAAVTLCIIKGFFSFENQTVQNNVTEAEYNDLKSILNLSYNVSESLDRAKPTEGSGGETREAQRNSSEVNPRKETENQNKEIQRAKPDCPPLGLESLKVSDDQLQSSSSLSVGLGPHRGRLNIQSGLEDEDEYDGAWCAGEEDQDQWLQLDALQPTLFTGVILQGRNSIWSWNWILTYKVQLSNDSVVWQPCMNGSEEAVFVGNQDIETPVLALFPEPSVAQYIRINPQTWFVNGTICLRAEVLGCPVSGLTLHHGFFKYLGQDYEFGHGILKLDCQNVY